MTDDATDHGWIGALAGRFLVFDGPDGSGKSTQLERLAEAARGAGLTVEHVREPGGTDIGERIRGILLDPVHDDMALRCEMMLYMASRAQLVHQRIRPALDAGALVLADRYVSSTYAYQGAAGGLPVEEIAAVASAACRDAWPDLVLIYDVDEKVAARRLRAPVKRGKKTAAGQAGLFEDRMEQKESGFHRKVRSGFLELAEREPERHEVIDASAEPDAVAEATLDALRRRLAGAGG